MPGGFTVLSAVLDPSRATRASLCGAGLASSGAIHLTRRTAPSGCSGSDAARLFKAGCLRESPIIGSTNGRRHDKDTGYAECPWKCPTSRSCNSRLHKTHSFGILPDMDPVISATETAPRSSKRLIIYATGLSATPAAWKPLVDRLTECWALSPLAVSKLKDARPDLEITDQ